MAGQNNHFRHAAPEQLAYAIERYANETNRLFGVLDKRIANRPFLAGAEYSIADIASYPWIVPYERLGQSLDDFPHLKRWFEAIRAWPATERAYALVDTVNPNAGAPQSEEARRILFGQTVAVVRGR